LRSLVADEKLTGKMMKHFKLVFTILMSGIEDCNADLVPIEIDVAYAL